MPTQSIRLPVYLTQVQTKWLPTIMISIPSISSKPIHRSHKKPIFPNLYWNQFMRWLSPYANIYILYQHSIIQSVYELANVKYPGIYMKRIL